LSDRFGRKNVLLSSFLAFLVALIGFAFTRSFFVIAVLFALYGVYSGIFRAVGKAFAADFVPQELRASSIGLFNATVGISGLIASITAGLLYDKIGHPAVFLTAAVFVAAGSILLMVLPYRRSV
jgi:MFS family permease